jgi:ankyrin repeat protein
MLSRFTKLPGVSTFLSTGTKTYAQENIDSAIQEIKTLGKREANNTDECSQDIRRISHLMRAFSESLHVQRVACHALSNLAMQVAPAHRIMENGGFKLIERAIVKFHSDHKLCWLASSAVWNLARPPNNRAMIGKQGARLMIKILSEHQNREKATNTAVGALSNLSLDDSLKDLIAEPSNLDLILEALQTHLKMESLSVMTSAAGLLANLAVNDEHASVLVSKNALSILMRLLEWKDENMDETLHRNTCAALNNLVTAEGFLDSFLKNQGIETLFAFLKDNSNELYSNLLENCLINIDADTKTATTSFHLCCYHGKLEIFKELYTSTVHTDHSFSLDSTDKHGMTCLDYAIAQKHLPVIAFLCKCGATQFNANTEHIRNNPEIQETIQKGTDTLKQVKVANEKTIIQALPHVPTDLCKYLVSFQHNIDMLHGMKLI